MKTKIFISLLCCLFLFIRTSIYSQVKFFIGPEINFKTSTAFVDPNDLNTTENNLLENQFFYKPYSVAYASRIVKHQTFLYGISAGIKFKNDKRILKLNYTLDLANFRAQSHYRAYNEENYSGFTVNYLNIGFKRFGFDYCINISKENKLSATWISFGGGVNINRNRWVSIFSFAPNTPLNPNGDLLLSTYLRPFKENKTNVFLKIGINQDMYIKKKYIFSVNIDYVQGFGIISRVEFVHEYNLNGSFVYDGTGLMSRGSGFYWGINRRLQVYPWKKKNNEFKSIQSQL
jgi:hypothetical protein